MSPGQKKTSEKRSKIDFARKIIPATLKYITVRYIYILIVYSFFSCSGGSSAKVACTGGQYNPSTLQSDSTACQVSPLYTKQCVCIGPTLYFF